MDTNKLNLIIQAALALIVLWYTVETNLLRRQSRESLQLLRKQMRIGIRPYLVPGIVNADGRVARQEAIELRNISGDECTDPLLNRFDARPFRFVVLVENPTTHIARRVDAWVYDAKNKNYFGSGTALDFMPEKDKRILEMSIGPKSGKDVIEWLKSKDSFPTELAAQYIQESDRSYVFIHYKDLEDRLYSIKRFFIERENGQIGHLDTQFLEHG